MKNNGGDAFPYGDPVHGGDPGMSLRDLFAGQALTKLIARNKNRELVLDANEYAEKADEIADAMIEVREVEHGDG